MKAKDLKPGMVVEAEFMVRDHGLVYAIPKDLSAPTGDGGVSLRLETRWGHAETVDLKKGFTKTDDYLLVPPALLPVKETAEGQLRVLFLN